MDYELVNVKLLYMYCLQVGTLKRLIREQFNLELRLSRGWAARRTQNISQRFDKQTFHIF